MKIIFCTEYGSNYGGIAAITVPVMRRYAERHGYDFRIIGLEGTGNEYYYKKHEYFDILFSTDDFDAIFYLDCDAMPTNHNMKVEDFIDASHDLFITKHNAELNGGALILKNTDVGWWMNDLILDNRRDFPNEQNAINEYMKDPQFNQWVKVLPHPSINSLRYDLYPEFPTLRKREEGHWHEGDFVIHVPGLGIKHREEVLRNTKIIE